MAKRRRRHHRRHHHRKHHRRHNFLSNPRRRFRRFRRNPIEGSAESFISRTLVPGAIGAMGAIGTDIACGYLPFRYQGGMAQPIVRILLALGVGWLVGEVTQNKRAGAEAAAGGVIVTLYGAFSPWAQQALPFRMNRYVPMRGMGLRRRRRMSAFPGGAVATPPQMVRLGQRGARRLRGMSAYVNPARTATGVSPALMRYIATR